MQFFLKRLSDIQHIWAIASSSRFLSKKIVALANISSCTSIVEVGPWDGIFTKYISTLIQSHQSFFTIERDKQFYDHIQLVCPELTHYNVCASEIHDCLHKEWIASVDCIISSLPWSLFNDKLQDTLMWALYDSLSPWWTMLTFSYVQSRFFNHGPSYKKKLETYFSRVEESDIIWLNLPPAFVYICHK